jgi:hypothetical protein
MIQQVVRIQDIVGGTEMEHVKSLVQHGKMNLKIRKKILAVGFLTIPRPNVMSPMDVVG